MQVLPESEITRGMLASFLTLSQVFITAPVKSWEAKIWLVQSQFFYNRDVLRQTVPSRENENWNFMVFG